MYFPAELKEWPDIYPNVWSFSDPKFAPNLFVCPSIEEAVAWLEFNQHVFRNLQAIYFFVIGIVPEKHHAEFIQQNATNKKLHFLFSKDDEGALCDLKLASYIRQKPIKITFAKESYLIQFENKSYNITHLSLNALEKASGYSFRIRTHKPKSFTTFYEQLRNRHRP